MILIDKKTALEIFNPPAPNVLNAWLDENNIHAGTADPGDDYTGSYTLCAALHWAKTKHPDAGMMDICSFAGLSQSLSTGFSSGFGTDEYQKERIIDNLILTLAGGTAAHPDDIVSLVPSDLATGERKPTPDETEKIIGIMDQCYFGDMAAAISDIIETMTPEQAAKVVLSMAQTNAEYQELHGIAKKFLARKSSIGDLRKAVRKISDKMKYIKSSLLLEIPIEIMDA